MGYELRRDLREALGPDITGLQRAVALEIADDAREGTRRSYVSLEELARWTGAKDTNVIRNALKRLAAAGWEFRVPIGKGKDGRVLYAVPGTRVTFKVPPFTLPEGVATATSKEEPPLPHGGATATPSRPQGVATAHSEGATATPSSSYPSKNSSSAATPPPREITDEDKKEFGSFWALYPKSRDLDKTRDLWVAAVLSGVDPKKITAAAVAYAHEVAGEPIKYIKLSATWLRDRRYNDAYTAGPPPKPSQPAPPPLPDWCGECDAPGYRWLERDGREYRCPACNPDAIGANT
jgi:hypothetical protein